MDYLGLIKKQDAEKTALITETKTYTYGQLACRAEALRAAVQGERSCRLIYADTIAGQLIQFLAYAGTQWVPVLVPKTSCMQDMPECPMPAEACMGVMTSGSSGRPKLWWRTYESWADFFPIQNDIFSIDEHTILFCHGSLAFTGNLNMYLGVFAAGGAVIGADRLQPKLWQTMMQSYQANALYMIPSKLAALAKSMRHSGCAIRTVTHIISGSQALGRKQVLTLKKVFPLTDVVLYYGASELNYITYIADADMTDDDTLVGRPFPGVRIAVQEAAGNIAVHTAYHVSGISVPYVLQDKGYIDGEGRLHYLGRSDDICRVNGVSISAYKVERALQDCISDAEVAVAVRQRNCTEDLVAFIADSLVWKTQKERCIKQLRTRLLPHEIPRRYIEVDALPKNESGKIDKQRLLSMTFPT